MLTVEPGKNFNESNNPEEIQKLFNRSFSDIREIKNVLPKGFVIPNEVQVKTNNLPHVITELPIIEQCIDTWQPEPVEAAIIKLQDKYCCVRRH